MYVMSDGPFSTQNRDGDEIPEWYVTVFDDEDNEVETWYFDSYEEAIRCGNEEAKVRGVEHIAEGMWA